MFNEPVVLLSGGIESATILALMPGAFCMGFDFGGHRIALERARKIADYYRSTIEIVEAKRVDDWEVRASIAMSAARDRDFHVLMIGWCATDWQQNPDGRPFLAAWAKSAKEHGVSVRVPLFNMTKRDVVAIARRIKVPIDLTWSCDYPADNEPCGACLSCTDRREALRSD